jgi:hypothetical protein
VNARRRVDKGASPDEDARGRPGATVPSADNVTAAAFLDRLDQLRAEASTQSARPSSDARVPMRQLFALAKAFIDTPCTEIEVLLDTEEHDSRVGAVSIMDWQARRRTTTSEQRRDLYELYLRRHDRIDDWDLVDRAAPYVIGGYLADKDRAPLYVLARSTSQWERRSAIVATYHFIRNDDLDDTFAIGQILVHDPADLVQKAVGGWLREAGKRDTSRLRSFLDDHAASMPRTMLRYAIEHLAPVERDHYMHLRKQRRTP